MEQEKNNYGLAEKGNGRTCATACREKGESAWLLMTEPGKSHASKITIMKPHHPLSLLSRGILSQLFYLTPSPFLFFYLLSTCAFSSPDTQSVRNALY
jgi:hypothetical protein